MGDILPDEREKPLKYKICVLGGTGVGKSCLTFRISYNQWGPSKYEPTIEDSYLKEGFNVDGEAYTVEIMDTAGQVSYLITLRDHPYITSAHFCNFFDPPTCLLTLS